MDTWFGEFHFSSDKALLDTEAILGFMARSYWANTRPEEHTIKALQTSLCYGVYHQGRQVGFARVVTDFATLYFLCDVFIDEAYRGQGLGKQLVSLIVQEEELKPVTGFLCTKDAEGLYTQYGFEQAPFPFVRRMVDAE